jgi:hypothetical protein
MTRKKKGDSDYINNREFTDEIIRCNKIGKLSEFAVKCIMTLANRAVSRLYFRDPRDKEDCIQSAILDCLKYWQGFDETVSLKPNAFAYFTQICKNGYAKEWKKIHRKNGLDKEEKLEFISLSTNGDSSIYSI